MRGNEQTEDEDRFAEDEDRFAEDEDRFAEDEDEDDLNTPPRTTDRLQIFRHPH